MAGAAVVKRSRGGGNLLHLEDLLTRHKAILIGVDAVKLLLGLCQLLGGVIILSSACVSSLVLYFLGWRRGCIRG